MTPKRPENPGQPNRSTIGGCKQASFASHQTLKVSPAMAAGVTDKPWEMDDLVAMLEQWELANFKPEYQFVVRQYAIGKGHSVSVLWRGGEVDTIFGFEKEADALEWIKEKSQGWLLENSK